MLLPLLAFAALAADPPLDDPDALAVWAESQVEAGCASSAERVLSDHLALDLSDPVRWALLARMDPMEAPALLEEAERLEPEEARVWSTRARMHETVGEYEAARKAAARALTLRGALPEAWMVLIRSDLALGKGEEARQAALEAADWVPEEPGIWLVMDEPALLERGLEHLPDHPSLLVALARHRLEEGAVTEARSLMDRAGDQAPGSARVEDLLQCVEAVHLDGDGARDLREASELAFSHPAEARAHLDALTGRWPGCPGAWTRSAAVWTALARPERALEDLDQALSLAPQDPELLFSTALSAQELGGRTRARRLLEAVVEAHPEDVDAALALSALLPPTARGELLARTWRAHPSDPDVSLAHASFLVENGFDDQALDALLHAREAGACQDDLHLAALSVARILGREAEVEAPWHRPALELTQEPPDPTVDEVVLVEARSQVERLRAALQARLVEIGYREGVRRGDRVVFRPAEPIMPVVTLLDDGTLKVQESGYVQMPDGQWRSISVRKMAPRRARVMEAIWPDLVALREAMALASVYESVWTELPDRLDALWHEGAPLDGSAERYAYPEERVSAMAEHWRTRTCEPAGEAVRAAIERYLRLQVLPEDPEAVLAGTAGVEACGRLLAPSLDEAGRP